MKTQKHIYISNILRFRYWTFVIGTTLLASIPLVFLGPVGGVLLIALTVFLAYYWLGEQMVCHACGKTLAVTKIAGKPDVCSKCGHVTDKGAGV